MTSAAVGPSFGPSFGPSPGPSHFPSSAHAAGAGTPTAAARARRPMLAALVVTLTLLGGCATYGPSGVRSGGLTLTEISAMLDANRPQSEVASAIKTRGIAVAATSDDLQALEKRGAKSEVIDAMMIASWDNSQQAYNDYYGPYPYAGVSPYYYSPWPWGYGVGIGAGYYYGGGYYNRPYYNGWNGGGGWHGGGGGGGYRASPGGFRPSLPGGGFARGGRRR